MAYKSGPRIGCPICRASISEDRLKGHIQRHILKNPLLANRLSAEQIHKFDIEHLLYTYNKEIEHKNFEIDKYNRGRGVLQDAKAPSSHIRKIDK